MHLFAALAISFATRVVGLCIVGLDAVGAQASLLGVDIVAKHVHTALPSGAVPKCQTTLVFRISAGLTLT